MDTMIVKTGPSARLIGLVCALMGLVVGLSLNSLPNLLTRLHPETTQMTHATMASAIEHTQSTHLTDPVTTAPSTPATEPHLSAPPSTTASLDELYSLIPELDHVVIATPLVCERDAVRLQRRGLTCISNDSQGGHLVANLWKFFAKLNRLSGKPLYAEADGESRFGRVMYRRNFFPFQKILHGFDPSIARNDYWEARDSVAAKKYLAVILQNPEGALAKAAQQKSTETLSYRPPRLDLKIAFPSDYNPAADAPVFMQQVSGNRSLPAPTPVAANPVGQLRSPSFPTLSFLRVETGDAERERTPDRLIQRHGADVAKRE